MKLSFQTVALNGVEASAKGEEADVTVADATEH